MNKTQRTPSQIAERIQRRRNRVLWFSTFLFLVWQGAFLRGAMDGDGPLRLVEQVKLAALGLWAVALMALLATGGGLTRGKAVRELLQDEATLAHRRSAYMWGYWAVMLALLGLYVLAQFEHIGLGEATHMVLTAGIVVPALRFIYLERRSERS